jgi:hypothetical protein
MNSMVRPTKERKDVPLFGQGVHTLVPSALGLLGFTEVGTASTS